MAIIPPIAVQTVLLCFAWYLVLSFTSQVTKIILVKLTYPFFLSQAQFLIGTLLSYAFITGIQQFPDIRDLFSPGVVPKDLGATIYNKNVFLRVLPLGVMQFVGKYFTLSATLIVPVATVASVKSLSPMLIVGGYRLFYRVRFPMVTYLLLTPLLAGVIMMIVLDAEVKDPDQANPLFLSGFDEDQVRGLILCVISVIIMACQHIYGKELLTQDKQVIENPASLVLNTDPSRPVTPVIGSPKHAATPDPENPWRLSPLSLSKHFTQRRDVVRLPYSVLDLGLDEMNKQYPLHLLPHILAQAQSALYFQKVQEGKASTNPFAKFAPTNGTSKPEKFTVIFFISLIGFTFSFLGFLTNEAGGLIRSLLDPSLFRGTLRDNKDALLVALLIFTDSLSHFVQTVLAFILLGSIPALSYSIASMLKRIIIIVISILFAVEAPVQNSPNKWFGRISTQQLNGLGLITVGLYSYDRWGSRSLKENRT